MKTYTVIYTTGQSYAFRMLLMMLKRLGVTHDVIDFQARRQNNKDIMYCRIVTR